MRANKFKDEFGSLFESCKSGMSFTDPGNECCILTHDICSSGTLSRDEILDKYGLTSSVSIAFLLNNNIIRSLLDVSGGSMSIVFSITEEGEKALKMWETLRPVYSIYNILRKCEITSFEELELQLTLEGNANALDDSVAELIYDIYCAGIYLHDVSSIVRDICEAPEEVIFPLGLKWKRLAELLRHHDDF